MKALAFVATFLLTASSAFASIYQDTWIVTETQATPSKATKADGSSITIPGEYLLSLALKTKDAYGAEQRWVKEQTVVSSPTESQPGIINIVIETTTELQCGDHVPEISLGMMASDSSQASVLVQAGKYNVFLDGQLAGSVEVKGENQAVYTEDPGYVEAVSTVNWQRLETALSGLAQMGFESEGIKVNISKIAQATYNISYWFSEVRTLNESTGEFYVAREELKGTLMVPTSTFTYQRCDGSQELRVGAEGGELNVYINSSGEKSATLKVDGRQEIRLQTFQ